MEIDPERIRQLRTTTVSELKKLREEIGLTIREVCKECGMMPRTLMRLETGESNPRILTLMKLYSYYNKYNKRTKADNSPPGRPPS
jgi:transcriptional regulator with XRE-family HTH domain